MHGKVEIVTGAGAEKNEVGIGSAIALLLAAEGAKVTRADLDLMRAEVTAQMICYAEGAAILRAGDVTDPGDSERFVKTTIAVRGRLDILINNVDIAGPMTLADVTLAEWRRVMETNLTSTMLMCRAAKPRMVATGAAASPIFRQYLLCGQWARSPPDLQKRRCISFRASSAYCMEGNAYALNRWPQAIWQHLCYAIHVRRNARKTPQGWALGHRGRCLGRSPCRPLPVQRRGAIYQWRTARGGRRS